MASLIQPGGCLGLQGRLRTTTSTGSAMFRRARQRNLFGLQVPPVKWTATPRCELLLVSARGPNGYDDDYFRRKRMRLRRSGRRPPFFIDSKFSVQKILVSVNVILFLMQMCSAANYAPVLNAILRASGYFGPDLEAVDMVQRLAVGSSPLVVTGRPGPGLRMRPYGQCLIVASSVGPFTMDFVHQTLLTRFQPHRLLTAGFLHGSIVHLLFNMRYLWTMPKWLEEGLGWPLYLSTYLLSIAAGNLARSYVASSGEAAISLCLGASGGICGLQGLCWITLRKMGNKTASRSVFTNMLWLILFGAITEGISNAGHVGGFIGGALVGWLFGPQYGSSYAMKRKWSVAVETETPEYRKMMGFGVEPKNGKLKLWNLWAAVAALILARPEFRTIPSCVWRGFKHPGSLSGIHMNPL